MYVEDDHSLTRFFNLKFREADILEAEIACGIRREEPDTAPDQSKLLSSHLKDGTYQNRLKALSRLFNRTRTQPLPQPLDYLFRLGQRAFDGLDSAEVSESGHDTGGNEKEGVRMRLLGRLQLPRRTETDHLRNQEMIGKSGKVASGADFTGVSGPIAPAEPTISAKQARKEGTLVTSHPPHPRWDDTPRYDLNYDNPYYTRVVENFLWLPRDPFGIVDLDDTVDCYRAVTVESDESIGGWLGMVPSGVGVGVKRATSPEVGVGSGTGLGSMAEEEEEEKLSTMPAPRTTGRESIVLPAGIASRISTDKDIEDTEGVKISPTSRRQGSGGSTSLIRPTFGRKAFSIRSRSRRSETGSTVKQLSAEEVPMFVGQSEDQEQPQDGIPTELSRSKSTATLQLRPPPQLPQTRSASYDDTISRRSQTQLAPQITYGSPLGSPENNTIPLPSPSPSATLSIPAPRPMSTRAIEHPPLSRPASQLLDRITEGIDRDPNANANTISTQAAALNEVLAEEQIEAEQRFEVQKEEERAARERAGGRKGLFSWMWSYQGHDQGHLDGEGEHEEGEER